MLQYYGGRRRDPGAAGASSASWPGARRCATRWPAAAAGRWRCAPPSAARSAASSSSPSATPRLALDQERLRAERRRQSRVEALEGLQQALGLDAPPIRIECFDISNLGGTHTVASMVVFEGGAPKKSDYRRFTIRTADGSSDDFAAMAEVLARRFAQWERQLDISPHDPAYDASFATLPNLVVIDGGKGQLARRAGGAARLSRAGVAVIALAKRIEEIFLPGRRAPLVLDHSTPELQLLQRVRDEAHRFAITHHRSRRDKAMTSSVLDELPGIGPGPQARAAAPLRLAGGGRWRPRARSSRACPACRRRSAARCTAACTAPARSRW